MNAAGGEVAVFEQLVELAGTGYFGHKDNYLYTYICIEYMRYKYTFTRHASVNSNVVHRTDMCDVCRDVCISLVSYNTLLYSRYTHYALYTLIYIYIYIITLNPLYIV